MNQLYCGKCGEHCDARMLESGPSADCHEEAPLMVAFCPSHPDKCDGCEMRPLTEEELADVEAELMDDLPRAQRRAIARGRES